MGNGESMAENSGSKDRSLEALDFIINTLKEHEQNLDKSILDLAAVTQQIGEKEVFNGKMEKFDEKLDILEREVTNLIGYLSNSPKVDALKGKQIIKYTGAFANFPIILKTWLSRQLDITERNILEGFVDKSNQYF
jgi:hypothetical protein